MRAATVRPPRRRLLGSLLALGTAGGGGRAARATQAGTGPTGTATPPGRAVRLLVGFPPGGGTDSIARVLAEPLRESLGVPVVVENRAGAGGQIAAQWLRAAPPDGTTLLLSHDHTISILPLVTPDAGYEPDRDFIAVAGFAQFVNAIALGPAAGAAGSLPTFLERARAGRKPVSIGVPAPASVPEFVVEAIARRASLDLVAVPYKGSAPMLAELAGGQIPAAVASVPDLIEQHRAARVRIVAVLGPHRERALPEVPTLGELGIAGFDAMPYYGVFAPAATAASDLARLASAIETAVSRTAVRERLTGWGLGVRFMPGRELADLERRYRATWATLIRAQRAAVPPGRAASPSGNPGAVPAAPAEAVRTPSR